MGQTLEQFASACKKALQDQPGPAGRKHVCALVQHAGDFREVHERSSRLARLAEQMERGCHHEQQRQ